ncbi:MAG: hypothetical protein WD059_04850 [Balneolaceae bacterium]
MGKFTIVNGFDRSGSSAITRLLSTHPKVELIMQPFNSGFIREKMYSILKETDEKSPEHVFFKSLKNNKLNNDLIKSHWHYKHSTTQSFREGQLHIIKTTINHFAQKWMNENYPDIDVWGIWRKPEDIVDSIIRNEFYGEWYEDALTQIIPTVNNSKLLYKYYLRFISDLDSITKKTAFLVAVRSHFFFYYLKPQYVIEYEKFTEDPNYLNSFFNHYELSSIDITERSSNDLNIIGKYKDKKEEVNYSEEEENFMDEVFKPLKELVAERHKIL